MTTPHPALMHRYNTEHVFQAKTAGEASLLQRLGPALANVARSNSNGADADKHRMQAMQFNAMMRELEFERIDQAGRLLRHTPVPRFAPSYIPPGWDEGMVRLASIGVEVGGDQAKEAGIGNFASDAMKGLSGFAKNFSPKMLSGKAGLGIKGTLAATGLAAGGLYLGSKAIKGTTNAMGAEASGPATYGAGRHGYQVPFGVNSYGQPQIGSQM